MSIFSPVSCATSAQDGTKDGRGSHWSLSSALQPPLDERDPGNEGSSSWVAEGGNQRTSHGVCHLEFSPTNKNEGPKFGPLNAENLHQMEKVVAAGNMPLRAELLDECPLRRTKQVHRGTTATTVSDLTEGTQSSYDPRKSSDVMETSAFRDCVRTKESIVPMSQVSEESVVGGQRIPNHLCLKNLDVLSAQLCFGVSRLTPEVLRGEDAQRFCELSEATKADLAASLVVEIGSEMQSRMKSQSDVTMLNDETQKFGFGDNASEVSNVPLVLDGTTQLNMSRLQPQYMSVSSSVAVDGMRDVTNARSTLRYEVSQSMIVEPATTASPLAESASRPDVPFSNASVESNHQGSDLPMEEEWEGATGEKWCVDKSEIAPKGESRHANVTNKISNACELARFRGGNAMKPNNLVDERCSDFDRKLGNLEKVEAKEKALDTYPSMTLFTEFDMLRRGIQAGDVCIKAKLEERMDTILKEVKEWMEQVNEFVRRAFEQQQMFQVNMDHAYQVGALLPSESIPQGGKLHLVVEVPFFDEPWEMLLLISANATVGMCKQELLRRIQQQRPIGDEIRHSTVILFYGTMALYEEDTLADIFAPEFRNNSNRFNYLNLSLRTMHKKRTTEPLDTQGKTTVCALSRKTDGNNLPVAVAAASSSSSFARVPLVPSSVNMNILTPAHVLNTERLGAEVISSGEPHPLSAEIFDELDQNESLGRRLLCHKESVGRGAIKEERDASHISLLKHALGCIRLVLLDRAAHSPLELHRRVARSVLEGVDRALAPTATMDEISLAMNLAAPTLQNISSGEGEDDRIAALQEAMSAARDRKQRTVENIKALCDEITTRLRIPASMLMRAESVTKNAEKSLLSASSLTQKELDEVLATLEDYRDAVRSSY